MKAKNKAISERQHQSALDVFDEIFMKKYCSETKKKDKNKRNSKKIHHKSSLIDEITLSFEEFIRDFNMD